MMWISQEELDAKLKEAEEIGLLKGRKEVIDLLSSYGCEYVNVSIAIMDIERGGRPCQKKTEQ